LSSDAGSEWPKVFKDDGGCDIILTEYAWHNHIVSHHPEMALRIDLVGVALADPHIKQRSSVNIDRVSYYHFLPGMRLYVMVVTDWKEHPIRIVTSFLTERPKEGEIIYVRRPDSII
jgi:hypothetical protein